VGRDLPLINYNDRPIAENTATLTQENQVHQQLQMTFVRELQDAGLLKPEQNLLDMFLTVAMELSVEHYATVALHQPPAASPVTRPGTAITAPSPPFAFSPEMFVKVDAFTDLIVLLVRCCSWGNANHSNDGSQRAEVVLITRVLQIVRMALQFNHDTFVKHTTAELPPLPDPTHMYQLSFVQQPYVRFYSNLFIAVLKQGTPEEPYLARNLAESLRLVCPREYPGFAFGWLELLAHRIFTGRMLKNKSNWPFYVRVLAEGLRFINQMTKGGQASQSIILFSKGFVKVLVMLVHDFPSFLLYHHMQLCDAIPLSCIQMRNIVLSAHQSKLPDPFTGIQLEKVPEVHVLPQFADSYREAFTTPTLTPAEIDIYLKRPEPEYPAKLVEKLRRLNAPGWNVSLINSVVFHVCVAHTQATPADALDITPGKFPPPAALDLFRELLRLMDSEGRYYVINAMANQLRYPNAHTLFFNQVLFHCFLPPSVPANYTAILEVVQEQITRVLVERVIASSPFPWGLLVTFLELARNTKYQLWDKPFIRCTSEVERTFKTVLMQIQPKKTTFDPTTASAAPAE